MSPPTIHPLLARVFRHGHPPGPGADPQPSAETYIPTWQRGSGDGNGHKAPPARVTGRRKPSASVSAGSGSGSGGGGPDSRYLSPYAASDIHNNNHNTPRSQQHRPRAKSEGGNMLYFGEGASSASGPPRPRSSTGVGAGAGSSSRTTQGRNGGNGLGPGYASGRDASGHLRTGVGSTGVMNGTYASLTYGGSVQL